MTYKQLLKKLSTNISIANLRSNYLEVTLKSLFEFFIQNNLLPLISPVLKQVTCALFKVFPSLTKYTNHLMEATKYGVHFLIYRKHLTKYGTKVFTTKAITLLHCCKHF